MEDNIRIEIITQTSPYLVKVIELGDKNKKTLGFLSQGTFIYYASKGYIIVALSSQNELIGYLLYRISARKAKATIVHLCIEQGWRGKQIAKKLVESLKEKTKNLYLIDLLCRRDYNLGKMWTSFGFIPRHDRVGKSKDGKLLTLWQFKHDHPNLITLLFEQEIGSKLIAVIDANIFYDLEPSNKNRNTEDSKALLADWLQTEVEICLTDEIYVEINRYENLLRQAANNNIDQKIMALKFSDTEIFKNPIFLPEVRKILHREQESFPSPRKISEKQFSQLYNKGRF